MRASVLNSFKTQKAAAAAAATLSSHHHNNQVASQHLRSLAGSGYFYGTANGVNGAKLAQYGANQPQSHGYYSTLSTSSANNSNTYQQQHQQQQNHLYQHPPTADLLGTGYQCHQQQQQHSRPLYNPTNSNQTTRLIWSSGNGNDVQDGFVVDSAYSTQLANNFQSTTPATNNPLDTGSVYQTIN